MKTPKEKAIELVEKFHIVYTLNNLEAKQCALICVDEILETCYLEKIGRASCRERV
jgi:hypothetical protein